MNEGSCIELDAEGDVKLRYAEGRIEFLKGGRRVAYLPVDAEDHEL